MSRSNVVAASIESMEGLSQDSFVSTDSVYIQSRLVDGYEARSPCNSPRAGRDYQERSSWKEKASLSDVESLGEADSDTMDQGGSDSATSLLSEISDRNRVGQGKESTPEQEATTDLAQSPFASKRRKTLHAGEGSSGGQTGRAPPSPFRHVGGSRRRTGTGPWQEPVSSGFLRPNPFATSAAPKALAGEGHGKSGARSPIGFSRFYSASTAGVGTAAGKHPQQDVIERALCSADSGGVASPGQKTGSKQPALQDSLLQRGLRRSGRRGLGTVASPFMNAPAPAAGTALSRHPNTGRVAVPKAKASSSLLESCVQHLCQLGTWGIPSAVKLAYKVAGASRLYAWQGECLARLFYREAYATWKENNDQADGQTTFKDFLVARANDIASQKTGGDFGGNLVLTAPTSGGKTLVAEIIASCTVLRPKLDSPQSTDTSQADTTAPSDSTAGLSLAAEGSTKVLVVEPYVSISREMCKRLEKVFEGTQVVVRGFYARKSKFIQIEETDVVVATIERANSIINQMVSLGSAHRIGLLVMDEVHLFGQGERGFLLEMLFTKLRLHSPHLRTVGFSATLPNLRQLGRRLGAVTYATANRPVPLSFHLAAVPKLAKAPDGDAAQPDLAVPVYDRNLRPERQLAVPCRSGMGFGRTLEAVVSELCLEARTERFSVLVFCPTRKACETCAKVIANHMQNRDSGLPDDGRRKVLATAAESLAVHSQSGASLIAQLVLRGIAFHHAGLSSEERVIVEGCFERGAVDILVSTSTLGAGVNLPVRRVIFRDFLIAGAALSESQFLQMAGRCGRAGIDSAGDVYVVVHGSVGVRPESSSSGTKDVLRVTTVNRRLGPILNAIYGDNPAQDQSNVGKTQGCKRVSSGRILHLCRRMCLEAVYVVNSGSERNSSSSSNLTDPPRGGPGGSFGSQQDGYSPQARIHDIRRFVGRCLLFQDHALENSNAQTDVVTQCVDWLLRHGMLAVSEDETNPPRDNSAGHGNDTADVKGQPAPLRDQTLCELTALGFSCQQSGLTPEEALQVTSELDAVMGGVVLSSHDHVLFLCLFGCTALRVGGQLVTGSEAGGAGLVFGKLSAFLQQRVSPALLTAVHLSKEVMDNAAQSTARAPGIRARMARLVAACLLGDATAAEKPAKALDTYSKILPASSVTMAVLQELLQHASVTCGRLLLFCRALGHSALAAVLDQLAARLEHQVRPELLALMQVPGMQIAHARALYAARLTGVDMLASASDDAVAAALRRRASLAPRRAMALARAFRRHARAVAAAGAAPNDIGSLGSAADADLAVQRTPGAVSGVVVLSAEDVSLPQLAEVLNGSGVCAIDSIDRGPHKRGTRKSGTEKMRKPCLLLCTPLSAEVAISSPREADKQAAVRLRAVRVRLTRHAAPSTQLLVACCPLRRLASLRPLLAAMDHRRFRLVATEFLALPLRLLEAIYPLRAEFCDVSSRMWLKHTSQASLEHLVNHRLEAVRVFAQDSGVWAKGLASKVARALQLTKTGLASAARLEAALHAQLVIDALGKVEAPAAVLELEEKSIKAAVGLTVNGIGISHEFAVNLISTLSGEMQALEHAAVPYLAGSGVDSTLKDVTSKTIAGVLCREYPDLPGSTTTRRSHAVSTRAEVLRSHPSLFAKLVLQYRSAELLKTRLNTIVQHAERHRDARVHPKLDMVSETGRIVCLAPGLHSLKKSITVPLLSAAQNMCLPPGRKTHCTYDINVRDLYCAAPGHVLLHGDFKQLELRILASMAQDVALIDCLQTKDPFLSIARRLFNVSIPEKVSPEQRSQAKRSVYAVLYGQGSRGLAEALGISEDAAAGLMTDFQHYFRKIFAFMSRVLKQWKGAGFVRTISGRRRYLTTGEDEMDSTIRGRIEANGRAAVNTIAQGSAADILRSSMQNVQEAADFIVFCAKGMTAHNDPSDTAKVLAMSPPSPAHGRFAYILAYLKQASPPVDLRPYCLQSPMRCVFQHHDELVYDVPKALVGLASEVLRNEMTVHTCFAENIRLEVTMRTTQ